MKEEKKIYATIKELLWLIFIIISLAIYQKLEGVLEGIRYTILFTPISIFGIILFVKNGGIVVRFLNNKFFRYIGDLSAYMFLTHQIIIMGIQIILDKMGVEVGYRIILIITSLIVNIVFAEIYVRFDIYGKIEQIFVRKINRQKCKNEIK